MPNAFWLFIVIAWSLLMVCIGLGIGYGIRDREVRRAREDWRPSQVEYKNVRAISAYREMAKTR